jgi:hypothetical protein
VNEAIVSVLRAGIARSALSAKETNGLLQMREEEKLWKCGPSSTINCNTCIGIQVLCAKSKNAKRIDIFTDSRSKTGS